MGHFGRSPIKFSWFLIVFPALLLNYFGQGALLIADPKAIDNPFYRLAPDWALIPFIILASTATVIASQAVISGVFSITSQAVQLGYIPRLRIKHTSNKEHGEVYLSKINLFLFLGVVLLILGFKNSENLSHAYGISVTGAMLVDTILATFLLITVRKWNKLIFFLQI
jgi:KUP system potassium uptake protein